jgi:hypothetical protein
MYISYLTYTFNMKVISTIFFTMLCLKEGYMCEIFHIMHHAGAQSLGY